MTAEKTAKKKTARKATTAKRASSTRTKKASTAKRASKRKAPTTVTTPTATSRRIGWPVYVAGLILCVGIGTSAALGLSDKGQINIDGVVQEKKRNASPEEKAELDRVGERRTNPQQAVDGGLTPSADQRSKTQPIATPAPEAATSSAASSTESESATSTDTGTTTDDQASSAEATADGGLVPSDE